MKYLKIGEVEYYTRSEPNGYGYQIMGKTRIDEIRKKFSQLFISYDKNKVKDIFTKMEETGELPNTFPDTSNEVPPIKILVHRSKHFTSHYNASTKEMLTKTIRHILTDEQDYYYKPDEPKNDSGVTCVEDLELIPFEVMRKEATVKWLNYEKELKEHKIRMMDWNNLQEVIKGKGNPMDAMREYESDNWDVESLITI
jgi:hypothetical protein